MAHGLRFLYALRNLLLDVVVCIALDLPASFDTPLARLALTLPAAGLLVLLSGLAMSWRGGAQYAPLALPAFRRSGSGLHY